MSWSLHTSHLPSSWGSSWQKTAMEVLIPPETPALPPSENAAPMASPSLKLWIVSPMIIIHATVEIVAKVSFPLSTSNIAVRERLDLTLLSDGFCETPLGWSSNWPLAAWMNNINFILTSKCFVNCHRVNWEQQSGFHTYFGVTRQTLIIN